MAKKRTGSLNKIGYAFLIFVAVGITSWLMKDDTPTNRQNSSQSGGAKAVEVEATRVTPEVSRPGQKLYVQQAGGDVRTGPGPTNPVLISLDMGHELIEFSRHGEWINVGIARTGGKDGWIHSSLVTSVSPGGGSVAPNDPKFDAFVRDVEKLNDKVEPVAGFPFFTAVENLGDGIVQVKAHPQWLAAPRDDRENNLNKLFNLWSAHEASGLPIAVYVADSNGDVVMKKARQ